jgi:hypothetical protein
MRGERDAAADFIRRALLEQRQPLRAIHRRQIELNAGLVGQRREAFAVRRKDRLSSVSLRFSNQRLLI